MDLTEINQLITIRQYIVNSISNSNIDRSTVNVLSGMLLLIDNKILKALQTDEFKEYIEYKDVKKAIFEVAKLNNIKSGLMK
jgi:hypothetical protein